MVDGALERRATALVRIAIDPGHGQGSSPAGCDVGTGTERDYVLDFARDVIAFSPQWSWRLLRGLPEGESYSDRASVAAQWACDLVLCIHVNAAKSADLQGLITFYDASDLEGEETAAAIMRAAPADLRRRNPEPYPTSQANWTRRADNVIQTYRLAGLSVVLVELGFATSARDLAVLQRPESRDALCASVVAGVARRIELL